MATPTPLAKQIIAATPFVPHVIVPPNTQGTAIQDYYAIVSAATGREHSRCATIAAATAEQARLNKLAASVVS